MADSNSMKKVYPHLYRFAWGNREIPKGALVRLVAVGKLQSCEVELMNETRKHYITDRRALRIVELNYWKET
jgi:hypothetical protein